MPARKSSRSTTSRSSRTTTARRVDTSGDLSYETKLVIVVLLLLFFYPLGLVFMWIWMKDWPTWLKIIISLPLAFGIAAFFIGMFVVALFIRHAVTSQDFQNSLKQRYEKQYMNYQLSTTPTPSMIPLESPTPSQNTQSY